MLKKIIKLIRKYLGEIMLIAGAGTFAYNVFNFSHSTHPSRIDLIFSEGEFVNGVVYYYDSDTLLYLAIGAMLIVSGILIIKHKK